jgi:hypothetical protein
VRENAITPDVTEIRRLTTCTADATENSLSQYGNVTVVETLGGPPAHQPSGGRECAA